MAPSRRKRDTVRQETAREEAGATDSEEIVGSGTHGVGRALEVLSVYNELGCDFTRLRETRRPGKSIFAAAGFIAYSSGESGTDGDRESLGKIVLTERRGLIRAVARPPECSSDCLLKVNISAI